MNANLNDDGNGNLNAAAAAEAAAFVLWNGHCAFCGEAEAFALDGRSLRSAADHLAGCGDFKASLSRLARLAK